MIEKLFDFIAAYIGLPAAFHLMKMKNKKRDGEKIKIVFMCQLTHVWSCIESIYEAATKDEQIEAYVLAIPNDLEHPDNDTYDFCKVKGCKVISAYDVNSGKYFDLEGLKPDYVFIPRPYDHYLPRPYRSKVVSKYAKVCYVSYCYVAEGGHILETCYNRFFAVNAYFVFPDNASTAAFSKGLFPISTKLGLRKVVQTPFPRFDLLKKYEGVESSNWQIAREHAAMRMIYAPRWATEEQLGITSFFTYKDFLFDFAKKHGDCELMVRPHPLAFRHFVEVGKMSKKDVAEYKQVCEESPNVQLDERKEYLDSFASADVLIADMSGVIIDFLAMKKPIIFCSYDQELNEANKTLIDAFYVSHNVEELEGYLEMLLRGEDPKKELRDAITKELIGECDGKNGARIVEMIKEDAGLGA